MPPPRRLQQRRVSRVWLRVGLLLLISACALPVLKIVHIYLLAQALQRDVRTLEGFFQHPDQTDIAQSIALLDQSRQHALSLRAEAAPFFPLLRRLDWLPVYGADLAAAEPLLDIAVRATTTAHELATALMPDQQALASGQSHTALLVDRLAAAQPTIIQSQQEFTSLLRIWEQLPHASFSPGLQYRVQQVDRLLPLARIAIDILPVLPGLLGAEKPRTYLVIAQNPDELRATGGFMSGAGLMTLDKGRVTEFTLVNSGEIDNWDEHPYPVPPEPMQHFMDLGMWVFRDANWSPDFPTSAHAASYLYRIGQRRTSTDVIAFTPEALRLIVGALGGIPAEGSDVQITSNNLLRYMRSQYTTSGATDRKDFMQSLGQAIIAHLERDPLAGNPLKIARALQRALDERHILLAFHNPAEAALVARYGWDGSIRPGTADFLLVVDTNMGYNKANAHIRQHIAYTVDLRDPEHPTAHLALSYTHQLHKSIPCVHEPAPVSYEELMDRCYWNYLRVYTPGRSRLLHSEIQPVPGKWLTTGKRYNGEVTTTPGEVGTSVFSTFIVVPVGQEQVPILHYQLPATIVTTGDTDWHYRLRLQKQSGREPVPVVVRVLLPDGAELIGVSVAPDRVEDTTVEFQTDLTQDRQIELVWHTSKAYISDDLATG